MQRRLMTEEAMWNMNVVEQRADEACIKMGGYCLVNKRLGGWWLEQMVSQIAARQEGLLGNRSFAITPTSWLHSDATSNLAIYTSRVCLRNAEYPNRRAWT